MTNPGAAIKCEVCESPFPDKEQATKTCEACTMVNQKDAIECATCGTKFEEKKKPTEENEAKDEKPKKRQGDKNNLYDENFLFQVISMLEFFFSIANVSPKARDLMIKACQPKKLQYLIQLSVEGTPQMKVLVQKIFQSLLMNDLPPEVFE